MKKLFLILISIFIFLLLLFCLFWLSLNSYIIPNVILPRLTKEVNAALPKNSQLTLGKLYFHPYRGFMLEEIKLGNFIQAKEVDLDLNWAALLQKKIEISRFGIIEGLVTLERKRDGRWNTDPFLALHPLAKKQNPDFDFEIKSVALENCTLNFHDRFPRRRAFLQKFSPLDASITAVSPEVYALSLSTKQNGIPIKAAGRLQLAPTLKLDLSGSVAYLKATVHASAQPKKRATVHLSVNLHKSSIEALFKFTDTRNHIFSANLKGDFSFKQLSPEMKKILTRFHLDAERFAASSGRILLVGNLDGQSELLETYVGDLTFHGLNLKIGNWASPSLQIETSIIRGILRAKIPATEILRGTLTGRCSLDPQQGGISLQFNSLDLEALGIIAPDLKNLKGKFSGNLVCAAPWSNLNSAEGGGYLELKDADITHAPISTVIEQGIAQVQKGFKMPSFKEVEGNFSLGDEKLKLENFSCKTSSLNLAFGGTIGFNGATNITAGIKFLSPNPLKTLRLIILPETVGFDMMANSIRVNISGTWPDLQQKSNVQPLHWLDEMFGTKNPPDPNRYCNLESRLLK